jgi:hypothetical protein
MERQVIEKIGTGNGSSSRNAVIGHGGKANQHFSVILTNGTGPFNAQ